MTDDTPCPHRRLELGAPRLVRPQPHADARAVGPWTAERAGHCADCRATVVLPFTLVPGEPRVVGSVPRRR